jgi:hypothetical protein
LFTGFTCGAAQRAATLKPAMVKTKPAQAKQKQNKFLFSKQIWIE